MNRISNRERKCRSEKNHAEASQPTAGHLSRQNIRWSRKEAQESKVKNMHVNAGSLSSNLGKMKYRSK